MLRKVYNRLSYRYLTFVYDVLFYESENGQTKKSPPSRVRMLIEKDCFDTKSHGTIFPNVSTGIDSNSNDITLIL